jgi:hypothetical protein
MLYEDDTNLTIDICADRGDSFVLMEEYALAAGLRIARAVGSGRSRDIFLANVVQANVAYYRNMYLSPVSINHTLSEEKKTLQSASLLQIERHSELKSTATATDL